MDTSAHEYVFCLELWGEEGPYRDLFAPILSFVETSLAAALQVRWVGMVMVQWRLYWEGGWAGC